MSIKIDKSKCTGCSKCINACPGNLIIMDQDAKAISRSPQDCWGCAACIKECPFQAIDFYLGKEIGGKGTVMKAHKHEDILDWIFEKPSGEINIISVNSKESNKY